MGSYSRLYIGNLEILTNQSNVVAMELFRPSDKKLFPDDSNGYPSCHYRASATVVIDRLHAMGHSIEDARLGLEKYVNDLKNYYYRVSDDSNNIPCSRNNKILEDFDFEKWENVISHLISKEVDGNISIAMFEHRFDIETDFDVIFNSFMDNSFFGIDAHYCATILAILNVVKNKEVTEIVLDYSDLVASGYYSKDENLCKNDDFEKTVILTEGVTDKKFIQRSLRILSPHIYDYYSFLDFHEMRLSGSTSSLVHTIKAFSAAGIKNRIIAIFDNDSAGAASKKTLDGLPVLDTIRIISLPELDLLKDYPTIGPQGNAKMNVNGLAGSIELYFEDSVLREHDGALIPVVWKGYEDSVKAYQGEISKKNIVQDKFESILEDIDHGSDFKKYNFYSMIQVLEVICGFEIKGIRKI